MTREGFDSFVVGGIRTWRREWCGFGDWGAVGERVGWDRCARGTRGGGVRARGGGGARDGGARGEFSAEEGERRRRGGERRVY